MTPDAAKASALERDSSALASRELDNSQIEDFKKIAYRDGKTVIMRRPHIMGILNVTPDSFFDGGLFFRDRAFFRRLEEMMLFGVDIVDVGGESTRPGANAVPLAEERRRVIPKIKKLKKKYPDLRVSIDTMKVEVAREAIDEGVDILNDVSAGDASNNAMLELAAETQTPIVLMHKRGIPKTMQTNVAYDNVVEEVYQYLKGKIAFLSEREIAPHKIILDVGIGFGKNQEHNIALIQALPQFKTLGEAILVGASMKSLISHITDCDEEDRLPGTLAVHLSALLRGANIIRVHDVKSAFYSVRSFFAIEPFH